MVVIAEPQTKPAESNGRGLYVEPERPRPRPGQRLDLARIAARRRAAAARREELVVQRAALFSTFLELQEWRAEVAAECDAAIWMYRKQAAACGKSAHPPPSLSASDGWRSSPTGALRRSALRSDRIVPATVEAHAPPRRASSDSSLAPGGRLSSSHWVGSREHARQRRLAESVSYSVSSSP